MRSPIAWLNAVTRTTFREIKCLVKNPGEVLVTFVFPLVWMLVVWGLLGKGVIEQVPVAMVDNGQHKRITPSCLGIILYPRHQTCSHQHPS